MSTLDERYPELIDSQAAPERRQLLAALDALAPSYAPPANTRAAIVLSLQGRNSGTPAAAEARRLRWIPRSRRTLVVAAAMLVVALIAGAAAALNDRPLENQALSWNPDWQTGTAQIASQHLGQQLNLLQSICGFSLTVKRVYADRFTVVVASTISGPAGRNFGEPGPGLYANTIVRDRASLVFPGMIGITTPPVAQGVGAVALYDIPHLAGHQGPLHLNLTVSSNSGTEILSNSQPERRACETYSRLRPAAPGQPGPASARTVTVQGSLSFPLTVPLDLRLRSRLLHKPSTVNGNTLILTKVLVTPIQTRLTVQGVTNGNVEGVLSLDKPGQRKTTSWTIGFRTGQKTLLVDAPLYQYHGGLTLALKSLRWVSGKQVVPGGPWIFHFTLP